MLFRSPAIVAPGHADDSVTVALGYGRTFDGRVGGREGNYYSHGGWGAKKSGVGFNAYKLRTLAAHYVASGAKVRKTDESAYPLSVMQEHGALEGHGPDIMREAQLAEYQHEPDFAKNEHWLHKHGAMDAEAEQIGRAHV